ncbi:MAG: hypothetical protein WBV68_04070, partial [Exiguobacterium oxidotolerans]
GTVSINDIKATLTELNQGVANETLNLEAFYASYLENTVRNLETFEAEQALADENEPIDQLQQILSLAHMSNLYRRAAERMIDQLDG